MRLIPAAVAALSVIVLAGCGIMPVPTAATGSLSRSPSPSATGRPTPAPTETRPPADILFTITATLTSPVGAVAQLTQVVYAPTTKLDKIAQVAARLDAQCSGWQKRFTDPAFVVSTITAKDVSKNGKKWAPSGQFAVTMAGTAIYEGSLAADPKKCSTALGLIPGTIRGITPVRSDGSADSAEGWGTLTYGFSVPVKDGDDPTDEAYSQLSNCKITVSTAAKKLSANAADWATQKFTTPGECIVNTPGV